MYETLKISRDARDVQYVAMNRPAKRNALSAQMIADLTDMAKTIPEGTRAVVLSGEGAVFCAGGDLEWMQQQINADRSTRMAEARKLAMMRYCEFNKVEGGKITETAMFFDIPQVMMQAGLQPFPVQTGAQLVQPGPVTHTGLCFNDQDPVEGEKTLAAINFMIGDIRDWKDRKPEGLEIELPRSWHDNMIWWGPAGIGASYTIEGYIRGHSGPFRDGLGDMSFNGHLCRLAEGEFGGFFGWPNLTLLPTGGFMGMPATGKHSDMRVIDIYRREGDKLAENWIFIDMLYWLMQQGDDVLARMAGIAGTQYRAP